MLKQSLCIWCGWGELDEMCNGGMRQRSTVGRLEFFAVDCGGGEIEIRDALWDVSELYGARNEGSSG